MERDHRKVVWGGFAALVLSGTLAGCSGSGSEGATGTGTGLGDATIVTDNPTTVLPWASIVGKTNISAFVRGADAGYQVYQRPVTITSAYSLGGIDTFAILAPSTDAYGPGDSGSPIMVNGQIAGAIFAGDDPQHLYGVSISQEMTTGQAGAAVKRTKLGPATPGAASNAWAGKEWYFAGPASMMPFVTKQKGLALANYVGALSAQAPTTAGSTGPTTPIPGSRYAAAILYGPEAYIFVGGTYTLQLTNGNWVATGHPIELQGPVQWPIYPAYTDFIENDGTVETHITGNAFGTLTFDGQYGSLIDLTKTPTTMPLTVDMELNGTNLSPVVHQAIEDRGSQYEFNADDIGLTTPVQLATYALPDLITASGTITIFTGATSTVTPFTFQSTTENPTAFVSDYESNVDDALLELYANSPAAQITAVTISLQMVTSPVGNGARPNY